ncbi:hypothetical protein X801_03789, partial [Opisthorchis viverrini]
MSEMFKSVSIFCLASIPPRNEFGPETRLRSPTALTKHLLVHTAKGRFSCPVRWCEFTASSNLKSHAILCQQ